MTGEKDRYTTTEKLWKLDDETLTTPKHDEMVLDLLDPEYVKALLPWIREKMETPWTLDIDVGLCDKFDFLSKPDPALWEALKPFALYYQGKGPEPAMEPGEAWIQSDSWHMPKDKKREIFNKILVENIHRGITEAQERNSRQPGCHLDIRSEVPLSQDNGFILGYVDVIVRLVIENHTERCSYNTDLASLVINVTNLQTGPRDPGPTYIEVKPTIKSFGQTLRQLNTYRQTIGRRRPGSAPRVCLYTPETRFDGAFESQGIIVLHPIGRP